MDLLFGSAGSTRRLLALGRFGFRVSKCHRGVLVLEFGGLGSRVLGSRAVILVWLWGVEVDIRPSTPNAPIEDLLEDPCPSWLEENIGSSFHELSVRAVSALRSILSEPQLRTRWVLIQLRAYVPAPAPGPCCKT